jgi:sensor histidine kinase regulating citrate/malate metabolism
MILKTYAVNNGLNNGEMQSIIHNMIKNSIESKSSLMEFKAILYKHDKIKLYVKDDGRGIRDKYDNIIKDNIIFNYGYSTKSIQGDHLKEKSIFRIILNKLGIKLVATRTARGTGLSYIKALLQKSNGDIKLIDTNKNGTTFLLTIPIKKRKNKNT